jgi:hypothetical protein
VTDIGRRRADRLRVMNAIYEAAEGSRMSHVSGGWLLEHLGLSDEELGGICRYLEGEHLITAGQEYWGHHTPFMILLTHAGIEEMKRSRAAPHQATAHFPPISVIHIEGDAIGSAIQVGGPRVRQAVPTGELNPDNVREIVGKSRPRQPRCLFLTATPRSFARTWRQSRLRSACPRRITTPSAGTFGRRVRSSNTPQAQRPPASLICSGTRIFESTNQFLAM